MARAALFLLTLLAAASTAPAVVAGSAFPEVPLRNHDGEEVLLHRDLLHGKVVVLNSFFTSCPIVCPRVTRRMKSVQRWLGRRLGRDVFMVSLTVDPETDTPERLRAYRERHDVTDSDWQFVTGDLENVDRALRELGFFSDMAENHTSIILVGNETRGTWRKADGLGRRKDVVRLIRQALAESP